MMSLNKVIVVFDQFLIFNSIDRYELAYIYMA
jgi:hypothetical protein